MKPKILLPVLIILFAACVGYYITSSQDTVSVERVKLAIEHEIAGINNLNIYQIQQFRGNLLVLYSYDLGDGHYMACRHLDKNYRLSGGSGPTRVDKRQPISITSFGAEPEHYIISYGEIYEKKISTIELEYNNGEKKVVAPRNGAFLVASDNSINGLLNIKAFNSQGEVLYHLP